ncbi:MAG: MFS transporter [Firmicutes bacterium]|nr:MFS transporter [Bacillota bacterium]
MGPHSQSDDGTNRRLWLTRNVWSFSLASLFSDWGHEMVTALMPGFLIALGAPAMALGLTEGVSNLAQAWASVWGGRVSDHKANRHGVLVLGYVLTGIKALMALVTWWPWVVVLRTLGWTGRGARGPIRDAYIAEEVPPKYVGQAYGLREAFDTAGALLGPLSAALLVAYVSPRTLIAWSAVPAVITVLVILRVRKLRSPMVLSTKVATNAWPRPFIQYRLATAVFAAGYLAPTFFILRVWQSSVTLGPMTAHTLALLLYTLHNVVYAASAYPIGWIADRLPGRALLLLGYGLWALVVLGFALVGRSIGQWALLFAAAGLATGLIEVAQKLATVRLVPDASRGQGLGQIAAVRGIGQLAAGLIMGMLWTLTNPRVGFAVEASFAFVGLWAMIRTVKLSS